MVVLPAYDAALVANVISFLAIVIAILSYRQSRRAEINSRKERLPDIAAKAYPVKDQPGWFCINLMIDNKFATTLYVTEIRLKTPRRARGLSSHAAMTSAGHERTLRAPLPVSESTRIIPLDLRLDPAGTDRHPHGLNPGARIWANVYVRVDESSLPCSLYFQLFSSIRISDVRRSDRQVSHQRIMLPQRQTS